MAPIVIANTLEKLRLTSADCTLKLQQVAVSAATSPRLWSASAVGGPILRFSLVQLLTVLSVVLWGFWSRTQGMMALPRCLMTRPRPPLCALPGAPSFDAVGAAGLLFGLVIRKTGDVSRKRALTLEGQG